MKKIVKAKKRKSKEKPGAHVSDAPVKESFVSRERFGEQAFPKSEEKPDVAVAEEEYVEHLTMLNDSRSAPAPRIAPIDPLEREFNDHSAGPTFLERASEEDDEDSSGMPWWGWVVGWVVIAIGAGCLAWWGLS